MKDNKENNMIEDEENDMIRDEENDIIRVDKENDIMEDDEENNMIEDDEETEFDISNIKLLELENILSGNLKNILAYDYLRYKALHLEMTSFCFQDFRIPFLPCYKSI